MSFSQDPQILSLTHHTFLIGPWRDAGAGAVLVKQLDDEDVVVLILKPDDVAPLITALQHAARPFGWCNDCHEWHGARPVAVTQKGNTDAH